jgi:hypothetical protein
MAKKNSTAAADNKRFLLVVPTHTWTAWKDTIPRSISLNAALVAALENEVKKHQK